MQKKSGVSVRSTESIVSLGKSKRLAAMRKSVELHKDNVLPQVKQQYSTNKKEYEIQQARELIAQNIAEIKSTYPQGKKNKLFELRYGSAEKINQSSLQKLFNLFGISQELSKEIGDITYQE